MLAKNGHSHIFPKNLNRHFFGLQRLDLVQKMRQFEYTVFEENARKKFRAFWDKKANFERFWAKTEPFLV